MRVVSGRRNAASAFVIIVTLGLSATASWAQAPSVGPGALEGVLRTLQAPAATEPPVLIQTEGGFLRFLGAPEGGAFAARPPGNKAAGAEGIAQNFIEDHAGAFGVNQPAAGFSTGKSHERNGETFVRLNQNYDGLPVFGAQAAVQVTAGGRVRNVMSDVLRDTRSLESGAVALAPAISGTQAIAAAKGAVADAIAGVAAVHLTSRSAPELFIWGPEVVGLEGPVRLVWKVELTAVFPAYVRQVAMVDAQSGEVIFRYSLVQDIKDREVRDAENSLNFPTEPARVENDPATGIRDVDQAYDFLGDAYDFYLNQHDYDSFDDAGSTMITTVRLNFFNAFWDGAETAFGAGLAVDDIVAHEYTHGVTEFSSNLIYFGFSGAINESLSDMWGEWIDLTNGAGDDSDAVRWFLGEDVTASGKRGAAPAKGGDVEVPPNAARYMKDPTVFGDPDRLGSPLLANPISALDNGGVHINSGIGNKLCYLLTDGGSFNGQTVAGMGITRAADLMFGAQFLMTPTSDYFDLFAAMNASALSQGFTLQERLNVVAAATAVEIVPPGLAVTSVTSFQATPTRTLEGDAVIALTWDNPPAEFLSRVTLLRSVGGFITNPINGVQLLTGTAENFLDGQNIIEGVEYYYTLIAELVGGTPQVLFARAIAGSVPPPVPAEAFSSLAAGIDLAFSQLTYTPVGPAVNGLGGYNDYDVTYQPQVFALPVARQDQDGNAFELNLTDNGAVLFSFEGDAFPFFGRQQTQLVIFANGYVSFDPISASNPLNAPTLAAHFSVPRISLLFSNLAPNIGGAIWARELPDRIVLTFENIPEFDASSPFAPPPPNNAQLELFHNGTIRMTYLDLGVKNAIVGISNGTGVPVDPAEVFDDVLSVDRSTDLSELPAEPQRLRFDPLPIDRNFDAGERITFQVNTANGVNMPGVPVLFAEWDGPGAVPFADLGNGSGQFDWQTGPDEAGIFTLRVMAQLGEERAYIDVRLIVGDIVRKPVAVNLTLASGTPLENPSEDRLVPDESPLIADYVYTHPLGLPEGDSLLYWFRDGQMVDALIGQRQVPPSATSGGETWHFRVLPADIFQIFGDEAISPTVTIEGYPDIVAVTPSFGSALGGETVQIQGFRLNGPISVTFGGVKAPFIRVLSNNAIEVTTPRFPAGTVPVVVTTSNGSGVLNNAFTYIGEAGFAGADVNKDGVVDATDVELVIAVVLQQSGAKADLDTDVNDDGATNSGDIQVVVNEALRR